MPLYEYTARDASGKVLAGAIEADNDSTVTQKLREMGFFITNLHRKQQALPLGDYIAQFKGIGLKDLAVFSRQFATMVNAGLSLVRTLSILEEQTTQKQLRAVIAEVRTDIEGGATLSASLAKHPKAFSNLYVNMVKAGEAGGVLDDVLVRLAAFLEKEVALRAEIKSATTYPIPLAPAASGVPIMQSLEVVSKAIDNVVVAQAIESVRASIREGESIAIPLAASGMFPPMVVQMVKVGEETGALETMLTKVADFYDQEIEAV